MAIDIGADGPRGNSAQSEEGPGRQADDGRRPAKFIEGIGEHGKAVVADPDADEHQQQRADHDPHAVVDVDSLENPCRRRTSLWPFATPRGVPALQSGVLCRSSHQDNI